MYSALFSNMYSAMYQYKAPSNNILPARATPTLPAKGLTKAHIDTLERLRAKAPFAKHAGYGIVDAVKSGMCGPNPLKYHAGAVAAWEEAGYKIDDCAKP